MVTDVGTLDPRWKNRQELKYFEIVLLAYKTFAYKKNTQNTMQY